MGVGERYPNHLFKAIRHEKVIGLDDLYILRVRSYMGQGAVVILHLTHELGVADDADSRVDRGEPLRDLA